MADALAHPTWDMGGKITIDSATLMNKGLEVIEAHHLFGLDYDRIDVVVHPQSIVHSLIHLADGASLAHLGYPDMRVPISYALHHPDRADVPVSRLDLAELGELTFEEPDEDTFACLRLARDAGRAGGTAPCVLNAANEIAVQAFLDERLSFTGIAAVIETTLEAMPVAPVGHFADLFTVDAEARERAREALAGMAPHERAELDPGVRGLRVPGDHARARPLHRWPSWWACGSRSSRCSSRRRWRRSSAARPSTHRRDPRGRLREDQRHEPGRGAPRGGPRPGLPRPAGVEADRGDPGRPGGEPGAGAGADVRLLLADRRTGDRHHTRSMQIEKGYPAAAAL